MTASQQKEVIRFLKTPTGKVFLNALAESNDQLLDEIRQKTLPDFYNAIYAAEFDPRFNTSNSQSVDEAGKSVPDKSGAAE